MNVSIHHVNDNGGSAIRIHRNVHFEDETVLMGFFSGLDFDCYTHYLHAFLRESINRLDPHTSDFGISLA